VKSRCTSQRDRSTHHRMGRETGLSPGPTQEHQREARLRRFRHRRLPSWPTCTLYPPPRQPKIHTPPHSEPWAPVAAIHTLTCMSLRGINSSILCINTCDTSLGQRSGRLWDELERSIDLRTNRKTEQKMTGEQYRPSLGMKAFLFGTSILRHFVAAAAAAASHPVFA
jgi:hypothetical protein